MTDIERRRLKKHVELHEGKRQFPYTDTVGKISIAIGRNLTDVGLSETTIQQMFEEDLQKTLQFLETLGWWRDLDTVRQRAIADMTFNLMGKILQFRGMIAALKAKDWNTAADHVRNSLFAQQTGQRAEDLATMIRTGQDV